MIPAQLKVHTISVEPFTGRNAYGPTFGAPVDVACYVEGAIELVRSSDGNEATSSTKVFCDPDVAIPEHSRVTFNGVISTVMAVQTFTTGGLTDLDHLEVSCG